MSSASIQFAKESIQVARAWLFYNRAERGAETCPDSLRDLGITAKHRTYLDMRIQRNWCAQPYRTPHQAIRRPTSGGPQMSSLRWRACRSPQSEAARQNLAVAHSVISPMPRRSTRVASSPWAASYWLAPVNCIMRERSISFLPGCGKGLRSALGVPPSLRVC
jgi:hypothetical protein